jgi:hypothetical protein
MKWEVIVEENGKDVQTDSSKFFMKFSSSYCIKPFFEFSAPYCIKKGKAWPTFQTRFHNWFFRNVLPRQVAHSKLDIQKITSSESLKIEFKKPVQFFCIGTLQAWFCDV